MFFSIFWRFLILGCTSFGGPAAHIGYFRKEFVERLKWVSEAQYAQWVALSQVMPGPGSSQVGFAVGYHRAGVGGALAAFLGFTLPSVVLMCAFVLVGAQFSQSSLFLGVLAALKLMAVVIVIDAVWGMVNSFCQTQATRIVAIVAALFIGIWPFGFGSLFLVLFAGLAGAYWFTSAKPVDIPSKTFAPTAYVALLLFAVLFVVTSLIHGTGWLALFSQLYQAGSLVFGGGHVVLPLMSEHLSGIVSTEHLLTGYAAAQAVPGPMFTLATYLGASLAPETSMLSWALIATVAIFLPGLLLMLVGMHFWQYCAQYPRIQGAVIAINAAVVGLLFATLVSPIITTSVQSVWQALVILLALAWLRLGKPAIWQLVCAFVVGGMLTALF